MYGLTFEIVDVMGAGNHYTLPQLVEGPPPIAAVEDYAEAGAEVIVLFIVTIEGHVTNPIICRSPGLCLNEAVLTSLTRWVFEPARVNGQKVPATSAQRVVFYARDLPTL